MTNNDGRVRELTCEWCGKAFTTPVRRGKPPRYCRPSHRQRAYEARNAAKPTAPAAVVPEVRFEDLAAEATALALGEEDRRRPTAARERAVALAELAHRTLAALGVSDLDDELQLARIAAVPRLARAVARSTATIDSGTRKTSALLAAGDQLEGVLAALVDLERLSTSTDRLLKPVPVIVPPVGAEGPLIATQPVTPHGLPDGAAVTYPDLDRRTKTVHVRIEDRDNEFGRRLDEFLPGTRDTWNLAIADHQRAKASWETLGKALVTIATGYHHPDTEPPPSLTNAGLYLGRRLHENLGRSTHWRTPFDDIRDILTDAGYIHIPPQ